LIRNLQHENGEPAAAGRPFSPICNAFVGCKPETGNPNLGVSLKVPRDASA
jgi:hypothetical protein